MMVLKENQNFDFLEYAQLSFLLINYHHLMVYTSISSISYSTCYDISISVFYLIEKFFRHFPRRFHGFRQILSRETHVFKFSGICLNCKTTILSLNK